jgi:hypothetical protein
MRTASMTGSIKTLAGLSCLVLALALPARGAPGEASSPAGDSAEILRKVDAFRAPYPEFVVRVRVTSFEKGRIRETGLFDAYISGPEKSLIIAREHVNRGMKLLYVREDMWVHLPDTHRPLRITPMQRMMGEASNGDIARLSLTEDYTAEESGLEEAEGRSRRRIVLTAVRESAPYHRIVLWVRAENYRAEKAEFYLPSGKRFKTARYEEYKPLEGRLILTKMTISDDLRRGRETTLEYLSFEKRTIPARYFNKNGLVELAVNRP